MSRLKTRRGLLAIKNEVLEWPQNTKICTTSSVTEPGKFRGVNRVADYNNSKGIYVIT